MLGNLGLRIMCLEMLGTVIFANWECYFYGYLTKWGKKLFLTVCGRGNGGSVFMPPKENI